MTVNECGNLETNIQSYGLFYDEDEDDMITTSMNSITHPKTN